MSGRGNVRRVGRSNHCLFVHFGRDQWSAIFEAVREVVSVVAIASGASLHDEESRSDPRKIGTAERTYKISNFRFQIVDCRLLVDLIGNLDREMLKSEIRISEICNRKSAICNDLKFAIR